MKAQKKPIIIDYFPIEISGKNNNILELKNWVKSFGDSYENNFDFVYEYPSGVKLKVKTLEGTSYEVTSDDIIIRGVSSEYYPCKKDIFEQTYNIINE